MVSRDTGDDLKRGAGLDKHLGTGDQGGQWIGTFALDSGSAVRNLGVTEDQDLETILVPLGRCGADDLLVNSFNVVMYREQLSRQRRGL